MSKTITSATWWKAALLRALSTAVAVAIPFTGATALFTNINWTVVGGTVGLAFLLSLITSLAGIPEVSGNTVPVPLALLERTVKTFAQALVASVGSATLFGQVHWSQDLQLAGLAALASLFRALIVDLPETPSTLSSVAAITPLAPLQVPVVEAQPTNADGSLVATPDTVAPAVDESIPADSTPITDPTTAHTQPTK